MSLVFFSQTLPPKSDTISYVCVIEFTTAQRQTGLSDWGDESFRTPFGILLAFLEQEAHLHLVGRYLLQQHCLDLLKNRLHVQDNLKHHPESQVPIERPIFIIGLPRSGTTFLHNLLAQDPTSRWTRLWELMCPSPPPHPDTQAHTNYLKR